MIGRWGTRIIFTVSDKRILTFQDFKRKVAGEWAEHGRLGQKDQAEFLKPQLQEVTFSIELNAMYGVRPRSTMDALVRAVEQGEVHVLVIGTRRVGNYYWRITDISEAWDVVMNRGELVKATLDITMKEYL